MLLVLLFLTESHVVGQVLIRGHHIGESPVEFLRTDLPMQERIRSCHSKEPQPLTAVQVHSLTDEEISDLALEYAGFPSRKKLEQLATRGVVRTVDKRFPEEKTFCTSASKVLENGEDGYLTSDIYFSGTPIMTLTVFLFSKGHLVEIALTNLHTEFADLCTDFAKKIGSQPVESSTPMQNAMGAAWSDRTATWSTPEIFAIVHDSRNPAKPELSLFLQSANFHAAGVAIKAARGSVLN